MSWTKKDLLGLEYLTKEEIELILSTADSFKEVSSREIKKVPALRGKTVVNLFYEPSTRTRVSFEVAAKRLSADVINIATETSSVKKGETLVDTGKNIQALKADIIVMRHRHEGAAKLAAEIAKVPVINAGDGSKHHPTQAMVDLYTIWKELGKIDGLHVALAGDLRYGRAAASLIYALTKFKPRKISLISPPPLKPRKEIEDFLKDSKLKFFVGEKLEEIVGDIDVLYVTRIQKERFPDPAEYEKVRDSYRIELGLLQRAKSNMIILHPLPKVNEIDLSVDESKHARYFQQAAYGVPVRMALLALLLGAVR